MRIAPGVAALALLTALLLTSGAEARSVQTVTIELTSVIATRSDHDLPPKGKLSKGDYASFRDLLLNRKRQFGKKTGIPVGYDVGKMTSTGGSKTSIVVKAVFPKIGTITYSGPFVTRKDGTTVLPITGGTGGFKGATGTVVIGAGESKSPNTYIVRVPHRFDLNSTGVA
jgi:Allene oxide cyclase barrel like domain